MNYKELCLSRWGYYEMSNDKIVDKILEEIKVTYPNAKVIKTGMWQYIVVSEKGVKRLLVKLNNEKQSREEELLKINCVIDDLNQLKI